MRSLVSLLTIVFLYLLSDVCVANNSLYVCNDSTTVKKDTTYWSISHAPALNFEQTHYSNWSKGGISQFATTLIYIGDYNYERRNSKFTNRIDLAFGLLRQDLDGDGKYDKLNNIRKSQDKIDITTSYSRKAFQNLNYNAFTNLKTQFADGYKDDSILQTTLFAPAYLMTTVGLEYKTTKWSAMFSFIAGKSTFVLDERLSPSAFGIEKEGSKSKFELGAYINFQYKADIFKNINLFTRVEFFIDYKKIAISQTDVNIEMLFDMKINKFMSAYIGGNLIYDYNYSKQRQFFEKFGLKIFYNFHNRKV